MKKLGLFGVLAVFLFVAAPAQAATIDEVLKRMDEIIKEMQSLRSEFDSLSVQVPSSSSAGTQTGAVLGVSDSKRLSGPILFGETNEDIKLVQLLLRTDREVYPYGVASGFFGPKTQEAIRNLQTKFGLDPVGVVGPATTALLEAFFTKYPGTDFPSDALATDPRVLGASTSAPADNSVAGQIAAVQAEINKITSGGSPVSTGNVRYIEATIDRGEADVVVAYVSGNKDRFIVEGDTENEVINAIANRTKLLESVVRATISFDEVKKNSSSDADESDADDALNDAEDAIDDADDAIKEAEDDGDDIDWADDTLKDAEDLLDEADNAYDDEDWNEAVELADEAKDLAKTAEDRIDEKEGDKKGDSDEIDEIEAEVEDQDDTAVTVKYDNGDADYEFTVEEDKEDEIIQEVADELDIDESDVEDLIAFDYGDVDEINVVINEDDGDADVEVVYESGVERRFTLDEDNENRLIEDIAEHIDERESKVEDWVDFDYN